MSKELVFHLQLPLRLYQLEEAGEAEKQAQESDGQIYTWKTSGQNNWLEKGCSS